MRHNSGCSTRKLFFVLLFALLTAGSAQGSFAGDGIAVMTPVNEAAAAEPLLATKCNHNDTRLSFAEFGLSTSQEPLTSCGSPIIAPDAENAGQPAQIPTQLDENWDFILRSPAKPPAFAESSLSLPHETTQGLLELGSFFNSAQTLNANGFEFLTRPAHPSVAENGSYYGQISELTGRPRTVLVRGYFRSNGTYVRGHYRSPPRR
jgi:hypothetical protein